MFLSKDHNLSSASSR